MTDATRDFYSIGRLCQQVSKLPRHIEQAADQLHIVPAMRIDGVAHYDALQVEHIVAYFRDKQPKARSFDD